MAQKFEKKIYLKNLVSNKSDPYKYPEIQPLPLRKNVGKFIKILSSSGLWADWDGGLIFFFSFCGEPFI